MSSIIVLDSSDEESETPAKKPARSIPAAIRSATPVLTATKVTSKEKKSRHIPSGITVTCHSPVTTVTNTVTAVAGTPPAVVPNAALTKSTTNPARQQLSAMPRINAAFTLNAQNASGDRTASASPISAVRQQMPQLQPSPHMRKHKVPTPPMSMASAPRNLNTPPALTTAAGNGGVTSANSSLVITSVNSMAASATPPLQLLATPPHAAMNAFNEQSSMINPHLMHHLPSSTTVIAQLLASQNSGSNSSSNNNNNNSFKIQLPPKRVTATSTPSPVASPILRTPPLASPNAPSRSPSLSVVASEKLVRRVKPTTVLKPSDEAWQQKRQRAVIPTMSLPDDLTMELLPASSSSPKATPPHSTIAGTSKPELSVTLSPKPQTPPQKRPSSNLSTAVLDLTSSPEKTNAFADTSVVLIRDSPQSTSSKQNGEAAKESESGIINLDDTITTVDDEEATASTERQPLEPDYEALVNLCREVDSSDDMDKLIKNKLIKYYYGVHPDFVKSRGFRKTIRAVIERIRAEPDLIYYNLKTIVEELKVRRKSKAVVVNNEEASGTTGNKRTDEQIKKLNKALYILTKRIEALEEAEVDWDDDDSSYLQVERFKKRACQIYEKICDLTGESKNAHRLIKKPIQFNGTTFPQFNKTLQGYINRTKEFPDYYDVNRMLEHCNRQYSLGLTNFEMKRISQDAFIKVGKLLQSRRKTDLYETVTHFTANTKDPAALDAALLAKLSENQKKQTKISEIIEKFAREQDQPTETPAEEKLETNEAEDGNAMDVDQQAETSVKVEKQKDTVDEEDDDDEDDEDDGSDLEEQVEKLANGNLSEAESDTEDQPMPSVKDNTAEKDNNSAETEKENTNIGKRLTATTTVAVTVVAVDDKGAEEMKMTTAKACDKTQVDLLTKTVNNNITRTKTVDLNDKSQTEQVPNGKLKENAAITAATPGLKIVSVSSLNESVNKSDSNSCNNSSGASNSQNKLNAALKKTPTIASSVAPKQQQQHQTQHRTLAVISISDEET